MKVLITGGAGFLGFHLASYLSKRGHKLSFLDTAEFDKKEYPKNCQFIKCDIRNVQLINQLYKKVKSEIVIHAAAALPLWKKEEIFSINVGGTRNILDAALKNKVKRVIFISSTAVYGVPKKHPIEEDDLLVGVGPYGQSKIDAEDLCWKYIKKGLNVTIIRPKTFVGTHRLGVFEILFDWIHDGKKIPVVGRGNNRYQLLDVDDLVEAIYLFMIKNNKKYNDAFNIGAEKFSTVNKDLGELFKQVHSKSKTFPTPAFLVKKALWLFEKLKVSPLYQWVYDTADKDSFVSVKRLTETLNWHPRYSNAQALIKAYKWYFNNYEEIKSRPSGITHTAGWKQGILALFKKFL